MAELLFYGGGMLALLAFAGFSAEVIGLVQDWWMGGEDD
jgi:hypothetical protein